MNSFLTGLLIGGVASIPPLALAWIRPKSGMSGYVKLRALGMILRFALIAIGLVGQLKQPETAKVPLLLGVVAAYFVSLGLEYLIHRRTA
ncbi:MAG: hypothetical protein H6506_03035 [Calditrichaeota bacterium]|nr:hypothetical protein [Calditrichota bacterium]MCB9391610.1 hypothetical protein [Calditrichota bacterium]